ncbi:MAG: hypothetical protein EOP50_00625 [Sphingobacteriales bacterium]|nr:MAG: hypothetical protein EOP50_00625 [Sphingobacteriales bacterium]
MVAIANVQIKEPDLKFKRDVLLLASTMFVIAVWAYNLPIAFGSQDKVKEAAFRLDSVRMLERAYSLTAARSSVISAYEFQDESHHNFRLEEPYLSGIISGSRLYDTLQYSNLVMTIVTDKEGFKNFQRPSKDPISIHGIKVGGMDFIDSRRVKAQVRKAARDTSIFSALVYIVVICVYFYKRRRV